MKDFAGRTAFVTGGANGVGIGLVRALLAQGCNVAMADIRPASIKAALRALDNPRAMGVEADVSSRGDLARAAEAVEAKFGVVTLLFNNAGVNVPASRLISSLAPGSGFLTANRRAITRSMLPSTGVARAPKAIAAIAAAV